MFLKRQREYELKDCPSDKRFRHNVTELFMDNNISADRTLSLLEDARAAGTKNINDLLRPSPYAGKSKFRKNASRDLRRRLLKNNKWPGLYFARIRVFDSVTQKMVSVPCPLLLPHEIVQCLLANNDKTALLATGGLSATAKQHLQKMKNQFGASEAMALGLWIDGAPCNWDRTESLECISLSCPGLPPPNKNMRIPICVIHRRYIVKDATFEDILDIVSWSFVWLAQGVSPPRRHDDVSFGQEDRGRLKNANSEIGLRAFLCEMRGDWKMFSEILKVPVYNAKTGCCFRCKVLLQGIRDFSSSAAWRTPTSRLDHWAFLSRLCRNGAQISNLFKCPGFDTTCIALDWLHVMDLGVAADFLGNLFWLLLPTQDGTNVTQRVACLFLKIHEYYVANHIDNRLGNLTEFMLRKNASSSPKLRASASEARALINFAKQEAMASLDGENTLHRTAQQASTHLATCYSMLSHDAFDAVLLEQEATKFCLLYEALERHSVAGDQNLWRVKPKMHLLQEMCMEGNNPSDTWTYRDEDFGGYLSGVSRHRGNKASVRSVGCNVLDKFRTKFQPCLR